MLVLVSAVSLVSVTRVTSDVQYLMDYDLPTLTLIIRLNRDMTDAQNALVHSLETSSDKLRMRDRIRFTDHIANIDQQMIAFKNQEHDDQALVKSFKQLKALHSVWQVKAKRLYDSSLDPKTHRVELDKAVEEIEMAFSPIGSLIKQIETNREEVHFNATKARLLDRSGFSQSILYATIAFAAILGAVMTIVFYMSIRARQKKIDQQEDEQQVVRHAQQFSFRLSTALEMAESESDVLGLATKVIKHYTPNLSAEILIADSSHAHIKQVATTDPQTGGPGCTVKSPDQCYAVRSGTVANFSDSSQFDACPYIKNKSIENACSATCIPITIMGRSVGALHTISQLNKLPDHVDVQTLEQVANRLGDRVGLLRAFAKNANRASTDPLTGLRNRRSFEETASKQIASGKKFAIAYCDLDRFKQLNDKHGHDAGDRALRLFSRILKETLRPTDLAARWGGEEFVLLISDLTAIAAVPILERVRIKLAQALSGGVLPVFTVSMGVNDNQFSDDLQLILESADESLLQAKNTGRNKIIIAGRNPAEAQAHSIDSINQRLSECKERDDQDVAQAAQSHVSSQSNDPCEVFQEECNDANAKTEDQTPPDELSKKLSGGPENFTQILTENVR
ncbi:GGDEF domain-containing protein [bacterium AH-315-I18]|nr:GGDEF domain-containing protein [bacterium AH-315-I18]